MRRRKRHGVLLLIVLSLLVLFLLVGLSFMVSAGQFSRIARAASRTGATGMPGHKLTDAVLYQLVRGTRNQHSAIQGHSLLEDLYGRDYMICQTTQVTATPNDQVQEIQFALASAVFGETYPTVEQVRPELRDDYYAGCVLTFLNGNARGHSARILEYKTSGATPYVRIAGITLQQNGVTVTPQPPTPGTPIRFLINGRPFSGTGAGFNPTTGTLNNAFSNVPLAFLPNYRGYNQIGSLFGGATPSFVDAIRGGLDETYDAVDYQNMFLGKVATPISVVGASAETPSPFVTYLQNTGGATPSFHRPFLLRHLFVQPSTASLYNSLKHAVSMRPSQEHHPAFTGSNPNFDEHFGPWDVDNDGDGIPDSIWIDAGLAPVSAPDGRLYKPLVAIQVLDLDGRINVNAAGSLEHVLGVDNGLGFGGGTIVNTVGVGVTEINGRIPVEDMLAFGMGCGPADIALQGGALPVDLIQSRYRGFERDSSGVQLEKLDGTPKSPPNGPAWLAQSAPGRAWYGGVTADPAAQAFPSNDDGLVPFNYQTTSSLQSWHGSPADYHARGVPLLDAAGNILWSGPAFFGRYEWLDDPYEINLNEPTTQDSPYDFNDLMALLRVDPRTSLEEMGNAFNSQPFTHAEANSFTTHSFSIPAVPGVNAGRFRATDGLRRTIRDAFAARIRRERGIQPMDTAGVNQAYQFADTLMAPEFSRGELLNINRALQPNLPPGASQSPTQYQAQEIPKLEEKARFARQLFNLMMVLSDANTPLQVERLAQWCVNVVDFGDADSVRTRFQYDPNPFDETFDPNPLDANLLGGERVVWGLEHPELLLTESLAFHDRLLEDAEPGGLFSDNPPDNDLDSIEEPDGSLFLELYAPRSKPRPPSGTSVQLASRVPEDLDLTGNQNLELSQVVVNGTDPVWRIAMTEPTSSTNIQDSRQEQLERREPLEQRLDLRRYIYFTRTLPAGADPDSFYNQTPGGGPLVVQPGSYLVIAPRDITEVGSAANTIRLADRYPPVTQEPTVAGEYNLSRFGQAMIAQSNSGNGCNISEPQGGYDQTALGTNGSDESLDAIEGIIPYDVATEDENDFQENFRTVLLQRLANPNLPFDAVTNPYLTLDWIPADLTIFNSGTGTPAGLEVPSRERTGRDFALNQGTAAYDDASLNIWSAWSDSDRVGSGSVVEESLGQLNDSMGVSNPATGAPTRPRLRPGTNSITNPDPYAGMPAIDPLNRVNGLDITLSSLVWHNRPYVNAHELMLVPASSSSRLTAEYTVSLERSPYVNPSGTFGHLLNFFETSLGIPGENTNVLNAYRIFDYVEVPSRFMGNRQVLNSTLYSSVRSFRDPGKVNLNTALLSTLARTGCDSLWSDDGSRPINRDALYASLRGNLPPATSASGSLTGYFPDGQRPAEVSNPWRASSAADLNPQLVVTPAAAVEATLLRSKLPPPPAPITAGEHPQPALAPYEKPATASQKEFPQLALQNVRRNAYFRYRDLMKMGGSVTSQSNVFAVWITVGYFEIEPNYDSTNTTPYFKDQFHPDGYRFGLELGSDLGQVVRHRAFYVVDRSIPVGFEPGVNHNVDKAILVRRHLE